MSIERPRSLEYRPLGATGLTASTLGFGAAPIANPARCPDADLAVAVVHRALDHGVTFIDTAPLYGAGESERRVGRAVRTHPAGARCVVATKIGYVPDDFDFSAEATIASVRASQERLGLATIPLVQVHELRAETWARVMEPGGALAGLERLKGAGAIGAIGVTGSDLPTLARAVATGAFATLLVWRHFHLLDDTGAGLVAEAARRGMGIIVGTPFASGILASGSRPGATFIYEPAAEAIHRRVAGLEALCARYGVSLPAVALGFILRAPGVTTLIPGAETAAQVDGNIAALAEAVPDDLWSAIRAG